MIVSIHNFNMTSEKLRSGTEHLGTEPSHCHCLRRGCSLVTVSPGAWKPGAAVLLTSVPASGRGKNI